MSLTYNNVDPTTINYKGTDVTIVKYGNTNVWGKHYTLSINAGSNTSVVVNRTSSPNQHAITGNLSNGATIYYGDTLTITYSVSSGYNINTHTVNGTTFTSGASYTVNSNISVVTTAVAQTSWHTVWSNDSGVKLYGEPFSAGKSLSGFSGINTSVSLANTKITFKSFRVYDSDWDEYYYPTSFNGNSITSSTPCVFTANEYVRPTQSTTTQPNSGLIWFKITQLYNSTTLKVTTNRGAGTDLMDSVIITKIEQYY